MKTKVVPVLFVLAALVIGGVVYFSKKQADKREETVTRAKVITPQSTAAADSSGTEKRSSSHQTETFDSFIDLLPTETLISSLPIDFNDDGFDDEVDVVRKSGAQYFFIVPALYNQETGTYDRLDDISTNISRTRTFSYQGMDVTGNHKTALVFQGIADDGNYIMKIFMTKIVDGKTTLFNVGDFTSDGTIFIQQTERSDSYELSLSKGEPYSVWVYKSDKDSQNTTAVNQIQQEYKWNAVREHYELDREIKVTASRLAASELSRIQDGTVETFAAFLDGLWYKTSNDSSIRYIYFDYSKGEIIQLFEDTQEVYEWEDSKIRHNGIYLSTVNSDISNLQRRFYISLVSVDTIKISLRDAINLSITEDSMWDGDYKKVSMQSTFEASDSASAAQKILSEIKTAEKWITVDKLTSLSLGDCSYSFTSDEITETGVFSVMDIGAYSVIQFRSDTETSFLNQSYAMEFGTKVVTETIKKKTVEKIVTDYDTLIFSPVKITPTDCFAADGKAYTFTRQ